MANYIDGIRTRIAKLKTRLEEYEARHQEKCAPLQDEITKAQQMLHIHAADSTAQMPPAISDEPSNH